MIDDPRTDDTVSSLTSCYIEGPCGGGVKTGVLIGQVDRIRSRNMTSGRFLAEASHTKQCGGHCLYSNNSLFQSRSSKSRQPTTSVSGPVSQNENGPFRGFPLLAWPSGWLLAGCNAPPSFSCRCRITERRGTGTKFGAPKALNPKSPNRGNIWRIPTEPSCIAQSTT
jgi:hypothetical protein